MALSLVEVQSKVLRERWVSGLPAEMESSGLPTGGEGETAVLPAQLSSAPDAIGRRR
jgi:hypothetical protein